MADSRTYRARYVRAAAGGWDIEFDPKLWVPGLTQVDFIAPHPEDVGEGVWFDLEIRFTPRDRPGG